MPAKKNLRKSKGRHGPKKNNTWEDHLTRRARAENYPARSVYKLEEIQKKFNVIQPGDQVLDLGCAPGSWMLYAARQVGRQGRVVGVDLKKIEIKLPENCVAVQKDILQLDSTAFFSEYANINVVLSDMAPATTGRKDVDAARSFDLCTMALTTAETLLRPSGHFVCKIFQGNEFNQFQKSVKLKFKTCKIFKPESCRKQSKEIYIIAKGKK
jgi:23S rRNA (uridine2552-2'-O)-methyltransferase